MIVFFHDKDIDVLKLGCALPNLAKICVHKPTETKLYPFTEADKDLLDKIWENLVFGPSTVSTRKAFVDEFFFDNLQTYANQMWGLMLANYMSIQCVSFWPLAFIRSGIWHQRKVESHLDETTPVA